MRISQTEEILQNARHRLAELEDICEQAENQGDDAKYADAESRWEIVEAAIGVLEAENQECNNIMQEKYYQQRVATAQSGSRGR